MRILYVSHLHPPDTRPLENIGGMQQVSVQLLDHLQRREDVEIKAEILKTPWDGVVKNVAAFLWNELKSLPQKCTEFEADIVLYTSMVTAGMAPVLQHRLAIPQVSICHGRDITLPFKPYQWYVKKVLKALSGVICVSEATRRACIERGIEPSKTEVIGNGCSLRFAEQLPRKREGVDFFRKEFGREIDSRFVLLSVGRQVKRKGHTWFVKHVMPKLEDEIVLILIGDGPEHEKLQKLVQQKNLKNRILLLGKQHDTVVKHAYAVADVFVMPNVPVKGDMEGFGIVILEANFAGTPVIASNMEGISDVIKPGVNGFFAQPMDAGSFVEQINKIREGTYPLLNDSSYTFATTRFNWHVISSKYVKYLKSKM